MNIETKYKDLCKEIKWRFKETDYKEDDKAHVVIHETIDKDMSFISISEVNELIDELGTNKVLEIKESYVSEFGEFPPDKTGIAKLRLILYWYFEQKVNNDDIMKKEVKL